MSNRTFAILWFFICVTQVIALSAFDYQGSKLSRTLMSVTLALAAMNFALYIGKDSKK